MLPVSVWGVHPGVGATLEGAAGTKPEQMSLYYRSAFFSAFFVPTHVELIPPAKSCKYFDTDGTCPHGAECKL